MPRTLSFAGLLAGLALAPTASAHADHPTAGGGGVSTYARDVDDVVAEQKTQAARDYVELAEARSQFASQRQQRTALAHIVVAVSRSRSDATATATATCYIPETLDQWTRRLIAVQFCSRAHIVPADLPTLVPDREPAPQAVGHCGHHVLHQTRATTGLPVSAWYTPTSC